MVQGFLVVLLLLALGLIASGWYLTASHQCPSCKKRMRTSYLYCPHCGSKVSLPQSSPRVRVSRVKLVLDRKPPRTRGKGSTSMIRQTRTHIPPRAIRQLPPEEEAEQDYWGSRAPTFRSLRHTPLSRLLVRSSCPSCQTTVHEGDAFCGQCGTALPASPKKTVL